MTVSSNKVPFEEALNMTGYSRYNVLMGMLCFSIITAMTFEIFSVSYLVPASACEMKTSSTQQGLVACVPLIGIIATSQVLGYLADTRGRRKILIISMTLSYVAGTVAAFSPNWIVLSFFKLLSSAALSGSYALSVSLLSEFTPAAKRSGLVVLTTSVHLASLGVMAVIAIGILPLTFSYYIPFLGIYFNSWRVLDIIFAVPCALSAIGSFYAYESPKFLLSVGKNDEALEVLKGMYVMNTGKSADSYKVDGLELNEGISSSLHKSFWGTIAAQTVPMVKPPLLKYTILISILCCICYITTGAFLVWAPFIVNAFMISVVEGERQHTICEMIRQSANLTSVHETAECSMNSVAMTVVFGITMVLAFCNIFMSRIVNCIGRKRLLISLQVLAAAAALTINSSPFWILSAVLFLVYLSSVFNAGFLSTYTVDIFPTYLKAMAVCLTLMIGRGSAVIGINILKRLLDTNCEAAFYLFGSITLSGGFIGFLLPSDEKISEQKKASIGTKNT